MAAGSPYLAIRMPSIPFAGFEIGLTLWSALYVSKLTSGFGGVYCGSVWGHWVAGRGVVRLMAPNMWCDRSSRRVSGFRPCSFVSV